MGQERQLPLDAVLLDDGNNYLKINRKVTIRAALPPEAVISLVVLGVNDEAGNVPAHKISAESGNTWQSYR